MTKLVDNLKRYMQRRGMSMRHLALKAGVDPSHLSRIISGEREPGKVRYDRLQALAKALNVKVSDLTGESHNDLLEAIIQAMDPETRDLFKAIMALPDDDDRRRAIYVLLGLEAAKTA